MDELNLVTVYEDENQKVEMVDWVAKWMSFRKKSSYVLDDIECENVLDEAIKLALVDKKGKRITTTKKIPVLSRDVPILSLMEPYDVFTEAILLISEAFDHLEQPMTPFWHMRISNLINNYYELQGMGRCRCFFFDQPINKVDGFLCYYDNDSNKNTIILPFILNDGKFKRIDE